MSGFDYDAIPAKPTMYDGVQYRSRLEAKWAAFFKICDTSDVTYEPVDLGVWSPDFMLKNRVSGHETLIEVKPISEFHSETGNRMLKAANETGFKGSLVLLGLEPKITHRGFQVGWFVSPSWGDFPVLFGEPVIMAFVISHEFPEIKPIIDLGFAYENTTVLPYLEYYKGIWKDACNQVQYQVSK